MKEEARNKGRLEHMLEASTQLLEFQNDGKIETLKEKTIEYFGVSRLLEIIGEAAYMLTDDFKSQHPDTNWKGITGLRHVLVHGYYSINLDHMRNIIKDDLPDLHRQIEEYLKELA